MSKNKVFYYFLQSCVPICQRTRLPGSNRYSLRKPRIGGEYRNRTDDLLHAMQAL